MPLFNLSPNVQESETASRKRSHDEFVDGPFQLTLDASTPSENLNKHNSLEMSASVVDCQPELPAVPVIVMDSTPGSSPVALTEAGSSTPARNSPSPNQTPSKLPLPQDSTTSQPTQQPSTTMASTKTVKATQPAKRKLKAETEAERAEKKQKKEADDAERAEKKRVREAEAAEKAAEKARINTEKEAKKAARLAEKEEKKRKQQEEELAAQRKQEKQKGMMFNFVKKAPSTPSKSDIQTVKPSTDDASGPASNDEPVLAKEAAKPEKSEYERRFQPFFVKAGMILASPPFQMDEETKEVKSGILDEYIRGERGEFNPKPFNATETFNFAFPTRRGIVPPSVRQIMENVHGSTYEHAFGIASTRTESQTEKLVMSAQDRLDTVPMKRLSFYEDVRPPYYGTMTTHMPVSKLRQLSRRPAGRVLQLSYDYDSEAEWVEDDGEDLDDLEDDEEDHDVDEEMEDFLDDSDDVPTVTRPGFQGDSQPLSTGICFEDRKRMGPSTTPYKFRLEFLLDSLEHHSGIDPFSTAYWPSPAKKVTNNPTGTSTSVPTAPLAPPVMPTDVDSVMGGKDQIPKVVLEDFKRAVISDEFKAYSKATVVEMLSKKFASCTKAQVKGTLDKIAHRVTPPGEKKSVKHWALLPAFAF